MYLETAYRLKKLIHNVFNLLKEISIENSLNDEDIQSIKMSTENMLKIVEELTSMKEFNKLQLQILQHDLKNRINVIKGYSEICIEDLSESDPNVSLKFISIRNIANGMLKLVNSLIEPQNKLATMHSGVELPFSPTIKKGSVLIVDDIESNRALLDKWLKRKNFSTSLAKNGREAMELLENSHFDIVLLDIMMPEMDGFEVLKQMKSHESLTDLIVIVVSAVDEMDSIVHCIKLGAMDYLIKPFDPFLLEARISACLQNKYLRTLYQERLTTLEKLSSLKNITSGIAHELKNPLNFVNSFSHLSLNIINTVVDLLKKIRTKITKKDKNLLYENIQTLKNNIEIIDQQGKRADGVIQRMHALSASSSEQNYIEISLSQFIELSFEVVYEGYRKEIAVDFITTFEPEAEIIEVIQEKFFFVLVNLFNNAFFALVKKKKLLKDFIPKITVTTEKIDNNVEINITDNGVGISDKNKTNIFVPFFTTKSTGEGIGLGLSLSHNIITQLHGGTINFKSAENEFTTFTITLPLKRQ